METFVLFRGATGTVHRACQRAGMAKTEKNLVGDISTGIFSLLGFVPFFMIVLFVVCFSSVIL